MPLNRLIITEGNLSGIKQHIKIIVRTITTAVVWVSGAVRVRRRGAVAQPSGTLTAASILSVLLEVQGLFRESFLGEHHKYVAFLALLLKGANTFYLYFRNISVKT